MQCKDLISDQTKLSCTVIIQLALVNIPAADPPQNYVIRRRSRSLAISVSTALTAVSGIAAGTGVSASTVAGAGASAVARAAIIGIASISRSVISIACPPELLPFPAPFS